MAIYPKCNDDFYTVTTTADTCNVVTLIAPKMTRKERAVWRIKRQRFF